MSDANTKLNRIKSASSEEYSSSDCGSDDEQKHKHKPKNSLGEVLKFMKQQSEKFDNFHKDYKE